MAPEKETTPEDETSEYKQLDVLCSVCQSLFQDGLCMHPTRKSCSNDHGQYHHHIKELKRSAASGCHLCCTILSQIENDGGIAIPNGFDLDDFTPWVMMFVNDISQSDTESGVRLVNGEGSDSEDYEKWTTERLREIESPTSEGSVRSDKVITVSKEDEILVFRDNQGNITKTVDLRKSSEESESGAGSQDQGHESHHQVEERIGYGETAQLGVESMTKPIEDRSEDSAYQDALSHNSEKQSETPSSRLGELIPSKPRSANGSAHISNELDKKHYYLLLHREKPQEQLMSIGSFELETSV
jgi:hypothetical protein